MLARTPGACDVFLLFLTNGLLTSNRGVTELAAAIELGRTIVILAEVDLWNRFAFDYRRWVGNAVVRDAATSQWVEASAGEVEVPYAACPEHIKHLIEGQRHYIVPYGRGSAEAAAAMVAAIFRVVANDAASFPWGRTLTRTSTSTTTTSGSLRESTSEGATPP